MRTNEVDAACLRSMSLSLCLSGIWRTRENRLRFITGLSLYSRTSSWRKERSRIGLEWTSTLAHAGLYASGLIIRGPADRFR